VVRDVFSKLSPILGVSNVLGGELPPEVSELLRGRDTPFQSIKANFVGRETVIKVSEFQMTHSSYNLAGHGQYGLLNRNLDASLQLLLSKGISTHLTKKIKEMTFLMEGTSGQIAIPFRCQGILPAVSVQPDLGAIGAKVLQGGASEVLDRGVEKLSSILAGKRGGVSSSQTPGGTSPVTGTSPEGDLSEKDQMIQQGMALFEKFKASEKAQPIAESVPTPTPQASDRDELIRQGMELLSKYRGTQKK